MDVRDGIQRRIEAKRKEVADLELKIREQTAYIRALEDTLRLIDGDDGNEGSHSMRPDSDVGRSREFLKKSGKPVHITDLLKAIGKTDDKRNRISLAGTLGGYARRGHVFTRPGPNTFGLLEFGSDAPAVTAEPRASPAEDETTPPDDFGLITDDDVPF